ncbi:RNA polymerase sigma-70 factor [Aliifodinibius sp. S!AR15-10]|uniref:RNA polymerase sigma-70 factor n=1 Tax=Aliifodinibius sp. S!AR15-10 TaxID=2950437 RepID=UPI002867703B|nr:RNA polymerase sigma-70 factor [Aliifodinibius sp. S!AR15-10]MDR8389909.1 RNA polymerase sigma-70 factor [Aliifodinibius sp. S!AR15-10]
MSEGNVKGSSESLLIERIRDGEEYAFEIAYLKYHTALCRYLWEYVRSKQVAEGIVQEVFTEVWQNRRSLNPLGHLRGFLFETARNKALDHIKHQRIVEKYISESKQKKKRKSFNKSYHREVDDYQDFREAVKKSISDLPPRGRQIYKLNREEGLTYTEISEYLDISVKTVETHMRRVLRKLRVSLSEYL